MRFAFPKKKKKQVAFFPVFILLTGLMMVAAIFGEGGLVHALSLRLLKSQAEQAVVLKQQDNHKLRTIIQQVYVDPTEAEKLLATYVKVGVKDTTIYQFKSLDQIESIEELQEITGLTWWQRIHYRIRMLWFKQ